jgi:hypothetical protein
VRSGSSLLADLMTRNGIGNAEEHLKQRALAKADRSWSPEEVRLSPIAPGPSFDLTHRMTADLDDPLPIGSIPVEAEPP